MLFSLPFRALLRKGGITMATTNTMNIYEAEKAAARELIDFRMLGEFILTYAYTPVGKSFAGKDLTLIEEIGNVGKLEHKAFVQSGVNYYHYREAFALAELTDEEKEKKSNRLYKAAASKVLYLNTKARELKGDHFVIGKINKNDSEACEKLVTAFSWLIQHPEELRA